MTTVYSVAGMLDPKNPLILRRPFQNPHHTISGAALIGGGVHTRPGAISLAHRGVLFLDELTEFPRTILECLRQPLEDRQVNIARAQGNCVYPADIMLVCAMNIATLKLIQWGNRKIAENKAFREFQKVGG